MSVRQHLTEAHGWSRSDFGLFGDEPGDPAPEHLLDGAHGQEHEYNPSVGHQHENLYEESGVDPVGSGLFNDRRQEGRRDRPR
jgi:hypothetical protein